MPLRQWGGVSFVACSLYSKGRSFAPALDSSGTPKGQKGIESGQNMSKVNIYLLVFVLPREFRRPKRAKPKYIFEIWCRCGVGSALFVCLSSCPLVQGAGLVHSFRAVFPPFCQLSCFACDTLRLNMALFRVLRGF